MNKKDNPMFLKLWEIMCNNNPFSPEHDKSKPRWYDLEIYAFTKSDRYYPKGTKVRVWMVSRMGDVGVTDNLTNPKGYDIRGLDADVDLTNYEFVNKRIISETERQLTKLKEKLESSLSDLQTIRLTTSSLGAIETELKLILHYLEVKIDKVKNDE